MVTLKAFFLHFRLDQIKNNLFDKNLYIYASQICIFMHHRSVYLIYEWIIHLAPNVDEIQPSVCRVTC